MTAYSITAKPPRLFPSNISVDRQHKFTHTHMQHRHKLSIPSLSSVSHHNYNISPPELPGKMDMSVSLSYLPPACLLSADVWSPAAGWLFRASILRDELHVRSHCPSVGPPDDKGKQNLSVCIEFLCAYVWAFVCVWIWISVCVCVCLPLCVTRLFRQPTLPS